MEQNQNENYLAILHPELMSREQLLQELKQVIICLQSENKYAMAPNVVWNTVVPLYRPKHDHYQLGHKT